MSRLILLAASALAALSLLSGCGSSPASEKSEKPGKPEGKPGEKPAAAGAEKGGPPGKAGGRRAYPVRVQTVSVRPVQYELKAIGSVEAKDVYRIDARVPGTIYDVKFNEGDEVKPDTVLCTIAPEAYRQSALKAKAMYDQAVANLADTRRKHANDIERMRIKLQQATLEIARRREVKEAGAISNEEIELYQSRRDLAEVELKDAKQAAETEIVVLEATIAQRLAELKIAEEDVRKSIVQSPIAGVIEKRMVTNQMFVTAGTPLATLVDRGSLKVVFKLAEKESAFAKPGDKVHF
ncbi:MAG TPA: HlyD family efflux transporter periplasmic adaptor subunit, partial [Planctomycetota bacterium]|nr:HlyD family efflux transporter periplasmic adaptor subunit [Planctomycetota bacterium]